MIKAVILSFAKKTFSAKNELKTSPAISCQRLGLFHEILAFLKIFPWFFFCFYRVLNLMNLQKDVYVFEDHL